jgi:hypothetical protein
VPSYRRAMVAFSLGAIVAKAVTTCDIARAGERKDRREAAKRDMDASESMGETQHHQDQR